MSGFSGSRFGGGGASISNPYIAYVRSDGNDSIAEIGNPAKPYLTATAAFAALKALHDNTAIQHVFNLGVGDFELGMSPAEIAAGYQLFLHGEGGNVGTVNEGGSTLTISVAGATGGEGLPGQSITVSLILRASLAVKTFLNIVAGDGGAGAVPDGNGGNGGNLSGNVYAWAINLVASGSSAGAGGSGDGEGEAGLSGTNTLTAHGNFCVFEGFGAYGLTAGCYVDNVFEYV